MTPGGEQDKDQESTAACVCSAWTAPDRAEWAVITGRQRVPALTVAASRAKATPCAPAAPRAGRAGKAGATHQMKLVIQADSFKDISKQSPHKG